MSPLDVSREVLSHWFAQLREKPASDRHYRSAAENFVAHRIGERVQDRRAAGADRRFTDTT